MSSYGNEAGAWDGGPPGAEADYAPQRAPSTAAPMPTTDPWTGVSYSHYGPPQYDYQAYGAHTYGYNYDSSYYQAPDGTYYDARNTYATQHTNYDYQSQPERPRSPYETRDYEPNRRSYRSKSRSVSPYERDREYSRKRDGSYEGSRRNRSRSASIKRSRSRSIKRSRSRSIKRSSSRSIKRSRSRSLKSKRTKYSSSDRSSRSPSYSRSSKRDNKKRRSDSVHSSSSYTSYKKHNSKREENSLTPPLRNYTNKHSGTPDSDRRSRSKTPKHKYEKTGSKSKSKYYSDKDLKVKDKRLKEGSTPPRKRSITPTTSKGRKKGCRSPATPPRKSVTPPRKQKYKEQRLDSSSKRPKDSSLTPPRCYARGQSSASSRSRSRSATPKNKRHSSRTPKKRRSRSSTSESSASSKPSRNKSKRRARRNGSRETSPSQSRSKKRSGTKSRSHSRKRSKSPRKSKSRSRSRNPRSGSRSGSGSPSDDARRGQFTVADRKRFWKMHRSMQEKRESAKSPPKEVKPPPGAVESTKVDDIEYGDPPEVEGPNFAELLPSADQFMSQVPCTSKSKPLPIPIKNDGSFLEMFKKLQEETKKTEVEKKPEIKKPALPFIGKRRGGRVLKTGLVKKAKAIDEQAVDNTPKDAWSLYMQEVKKYRETSCEEERKTRPLVK